MLQNLYGLTEWSY